jgi:AcrR family transcriptional regulator
MSSSLAASAGRSKFGVLSRQRQTFAPHCSEISKGKGSMSRATEIQAAATELFYERGYEGTSLKDIAEVLRLRAPSLYNHMESKQQVLHDIMFGSMDMLIAEFDAGLTQSDDYNELIEIETATLVRHYIRRQKQAYVSRYEIRSLDEPARGELVKRRQSYIERWVRLLRRGMKAGLIKVEEPQLTALNIVDLVAGVARWYQPGRWSEKSLVAHYTQLVQSMLHLTEPVHAAPAGPTPLEELPHGYWVKRRPNPAGDPEGRGNKKELVGTVRGAPERKCAEIPHLAEHHPHVSNAEAVQCHEHLADIVVGTLNGHVVGCDGRDIAVMQPLGASPRESRCGIDLVDTHEPFPPAGPYEQDVTGANLDVLIARDRIQFLGHDGPAELEAGHAAVAGDVQEHTRAEIPRAPIFSMPSRAAPKLVTRSAANPL